jgi:hypothetical protein
MSDDAMPDFTRRYRTICFGFCDRFTTAPSGLETELDIGGRSCRGLLLLVAQASHSRFF